MLYLTGQLLFLVLVVTSLGFVVGWLARGIIGQDILRNPPIIPPFETPRFEVWDNWPPEEESGRARLNAEAMLGKRAN